MKQKLLNFCLFKIIPSLSHLQNLIREKLNLTFVDIYCEREKALTHTMIVSQSIRLHMSLAAESFFNCASEKLLCSTMIVNATLKESVESAN